MGLSRYLAKLGALIGSDGKVPAAGLASGAALANLGYTPVNKAGDTLSGGLVVPGLTVEGNAYPQLHINSNMRNWSMFNDTFNNAGGRFIIKDETLGLDRLTIDTNGRITMPGQPGFSAYRASNTGDITYAAGANVSASMDATRFNTGSHYSTGTGKFMAPVSGRYFFSWGLYNNTGAIGSMRIGLTTSAGGVPLSNGQTVAGQWFTGSGIVYLNAGDTAWLTNVFAGAVVYHEANHAVFTGCLVG